MGVILPGLERDRIFSQFFRGIGTGRDFFFVGVGRERFENPLPCHPLLSTVDRSHHRHSDLSAATQPHTQQSAMVHCVL